MQASITDIYWLNLKEMVDFNIQLVKIVYLNGSVGWKIINPLVPDAHYTDLQDEPFSLQILTIKSRFTVGLRIFIFCTLGTNGLSRPPAGCYSRIGLMARKYQVINPFLPDCKTTFFLDFFCIFLCHLKIFQDLNMIAVRNSHLVLHKETLKQHFEQ